MGKHTPGPWAIHDERTPTDGRQVWSPERGYYIGAAYDINDNPENEANAHLIAAAPEMLTSLRRLVTWYGNRRGYEDELLPAEEQVEWIADAMRAIAKAEGA